MDRNFLPRTTSWLRQNKRSILLSVGGLLMVAVVFQEAFFKDRLPLFVAVDGQGFSGWTTGDVGRHLDENYKKAKINIYSQGTSRLLTEATAGEIGIEVDNQKRAERLALPLWLRVVPTSPLWARWVVAQGEPDFKINKQQNDKFITKKFGKKCRIEPVNASLKVESEKLTIIESRDGGDCERAKVEQAFRAAKPSIQEVVTVQVPFKVATPAVSDQVAESLKHKIEQNLGSEAEIRVGDKSVKIPAKTVISWLEFDTPKTEIVLSISPEKSDEFFKKSIAPLVERQAGISRVTTRDFIEVSRVNGTTGQALDFAKTRESMADFLVSKSDYAEAETIEIPPQIEYTRSYSQADQGMSAMLKHYAESRSGRIGVSVIELSGKRRRAAHNGDMQFTAASTYKLLLAFSVLKRVENGQMSWSDQVVGGRNLEKCFDDMIVISDNDCPQAIIKRIGHSAIQADMRGLGLNGTNFLDKEAYKTTASDLAQFSALLESRQLPISRSSQDKLIGAMRRNVYRQGVPAGTSGAVANKVGFLWDFLNDAAIVYSPSGTYALAIMTEKSSWAEVANITRQIENFRNK